MGRRIHRAKALECSTTGGAADVCMEATANPPSNFGPKAQVRSHAAFSLRTLIGMVIVAGIAFGVWAMATRPDPRQRLEKLGWSIDESTGRATLNIRSYHPDESLPDPRIGDLALVPGVTSVNLEFYRMSQGQFASIAYLKNLKSLTIDMCTVQPGDLEALLALRELEHLRIEPYVTQDDIKRFIRLPKLQKLEFRVVEQEAEAIRIVAECDHLDELVLLGWNVDRAVAAELPKFKHLRTLRFYSCSFADSEPIVDAVISMRNLEMCTFNLSAWFTFESEDRLRAARPDLIVVR